MLAITRLRSGKGFSYFIDDKKIEDKTEINRLKSLRVPPAWQEVLINTNPKAKIQAVGYDKVGRKQYIYSAKFRQKQEKEKFEKILKFAKALPKMRKTVEEHLSRPGLSKEKVLALIVKLMDEAYFRIGSEQYAKDNQHYGIATLRSKHVSIEGDTVTFDFIGKSGQRHTKKLTDRKVANIIKRLDELPGYEIFKYIDNGQPVKIKSSEINDYIKDAMGEEFSAKDFRTWGGTLLASAELAAAEKAESERERKKIVTNCVKKVARRLGNTPAIARSSYIDPRLVNSFLKKGELKELKETIQNVGDRRLRPEERCVLNLLEGAV